MNRFLLFVSLCIIAGCSTGGQEESAATPTVTTTLKAVTQKVTITGAFTSETSNTIILVNNVRAVISGSTWSYTAFVAGAYTTLTVQIYVNGILTDQHEISVDTASGN